jgi:dihydroorotate dehydrogenase
MKRHAFYHLAKKFLFRMSPEAAHTFIFKMLEVTAPLPTIMAGLFLKELDPRLLCKVGGLSFAGPVGLAAGLDKNGSLGRFWPSLGFGFIELGTVTAQAQSGNPKPRLFRFPEEEALINRMGFNNEGSYWLAERLKSWKRDQSFPKIPVGVNLGKSKITPLAQAAADYALSARRVAKVADYLVLNVSSPNTPGLRELQDKDLLKEIICAVKEEAPQRPIFIKLAPDLSPEALSEAARAAEDEGCAGLIATNTTIERFGLPDVGAGGLSGKPLKEKALNVVRHLSTVTSLPIIAVGGLSSVEDVCRAFAVGASAVQLYTALIYQGPGLVQSINQGLVKLIEERGLPNIEVLKASLR